eukprot:GILJ01004522.1.p1 GENE.GILJ01004522.1~~GILJ01004522.1.p1  ORF type:complete len:651 (-),score=113.59 GILJ01004522.1:178-2130(-)
MPEEYELGDGSKVQISNVISYDMRNLEDVLRKFVNVLRSQSESIDLLRRENFDLREGLKEKANANEVTALKSNLNALTSQCQAFFGDVGTYSAPTSTSGGPMYSSGNSTATEKIRELVDRVHNCELHLEAVDDALRRAPTFKSQPSLSESVSGVTDSSVEDRLKSYVQQLWGPKLNHAIEEVDKLKANHTIFDAFSRGELSRINDSLMEMHTSKADADDVATMKSQMKRQLLFEEDLEALKQDMKDFKSMTPLLDSVQRGLFELNGQLQRDNIAVKEMLHKRMDELKREVMKKANEDEINKGHEEHAQQLKTLWRKFADISRMASDLNLMKADRKDIIDLRNALALLTPNKEDSMLLSATQYRCLSCNHVTDVKPDDGAHVDLQFERQKQTLMQSLRRALVDDQKPVTMVAVKTGKPTRAVGKDGVTYDTRDTSPGDPLRDFNIKIVDFARNDPRAEQATPAPISARSQSVSVRKSARSPSSATTPFATPRPHTTDAPSIGSLLLPNVKSNPSDPIPVNQVGGEPEQEHPQSTEPTPRQVLKEEFDTSRVEVSPWQDETSTSPTPAAATGKATVGRPHTSQQFRVPSADDLPELARPYSARIGGGGSKIVTNVAYKPQRNATRVKETHPTPPPAWSAQYQAKLKDQLNIR